MKWRLGFVKKIVMWSLEVSISLFGLKKKNLWSNKLLIKKTIKKIILKIVDGTFELMQ